MIPPEFQRKRGRPKKRSKDLVIYYDVERKDIRSFKDYLLQKVNKKPIELDKAKNIKSLDTKSKYNSNTTKQSSSDKMKKNDMQDKDQK